MSWQGLGVWFALMSVADDYGRFSAEPEIIRPACFPRRLETITEADVAAAIEEMARARLIVVYQAGADRLLQIYKFEQRVRAKSKYQPPAIELLDAIEEPADSAARTDARRADSALKPLARASDSHVTDSRPSDDGHMTAVVVGVVEGEIVVVGGGVVRGEQRPPPQATGLRAVEDPGPRLVRPPQVHRPPEYILTCQDCAEILRTLNELTCRLYDGAGRGGEYMHRAHEVSGRDRTLRAVRAQVEAIGHRPGKTRFLSPAILFEPSNWDTNVNAIEGGSTDPDALRPLRV